MDGFLTLLSSRGMALNIASMSDWTLRGVVGLTTGLPRPMKSHDEECARTQSSRMLGGEHRLEYTPGSSLRSRTHRGDARAAGHHRLYATHMRNEADRVLDAIGEAIAIAAFEGTASVSHLKAQNKVNWPKQEIALRMLTTPLRRGSTFTPTGIPMLHSIQD